MELQQITMKDIAVEFHGLKLLPRWIPYLVYYHNNAVRAANVMPGKAV